MAKINFVELHIPPGINYECSSCGNCCLQWPVPLTESDHARLSTLEWNGEREAGEAFRQLRSPENKLKLFTHTLEKDSEGQCEFLTFEKRCRVHEKFGAEAKPAMCQLFPYTFSQTPSGVYASVSFASSGALFNHGRPLTEQAELLQQKYDLFLKLFPGLEADWSRSQLIDGQLLSWDDYLVHESEILRLLAMEQPSRVEKRLQSCTRYLAKQLPAGTDLEKAPPMEARPKVIDQLILHYLDRFYFQPGEYADNQQDLEARALLNELVKPPAAVRLGKQNAAFQDLNNYTLGDLDNDVENLLYRFIYCRIFAKLYFGYGFANLSVITGINHLAVLISLLRLQVKMQKLSGRQPDFTTVAEMVRTLERRLTQSQFSRESTAVLEILLRSPERVSRIISLAS